jgi:hypothetical protein
MKLAHEDRRQHEHVGGVVDQGTDVRRQFIDVRSRGAGRD